MNNYKKSTGFALPTVLMTSVIMLAVLAAAVASSVSIRNALQDQHYNRMARQAADSGYSYAQSCIDKNGGEVTWTNNNPLRPNTNCEGLVQEDLSSYVLDTDEVRTYFTVGLSAGAIDSQGFVEALRSSDGVAWKFWSANKAYASSHDVGSTPVGTSIEGYWTTAPEGYLLEDGSAVSRSEYSELFGVIGTTFGSGNGSTTFNVPNSQGRVQVAQNSSDSEFNSLGETGGAKTYTHGLEAGYAKAEARSGTSSSAFVSREKSVSSWSATSQLTNASGGIAGSSYTQGIELGGSTDASSSLQPYITVNRAIKY